jgi:phage portal protein BeeE
VAAQLLLHGNAWVQILTDSEGAVRELFALRPERFAEDRLTVSRATYLAGAAASVPLVEIRE